MTTLLRIGQFIQSIDVTAGGTSTAFLNTLAALRTRPALSIAAHCATPVEGDTAWVDVEAHREQFTLTSGYGRGMSPGALGRAVIADVEARRVDVLHIHGLWSPDLLAAALACRRAGVPYVWQPHGMLVRAAYAQKRLKKEVFMALGMRRALGSSSALVFVTQDERDHSLVPAAVAADRRKVVPLPVQIPGVVADAEYRAEARRRFSIPPEREAPCVVFMGRLHPVKRLELALRALAASPAQTRLLLVGGGDEAYTASLRGLAESLGVADRVVFAGWVRGDDKWMALAAGDALSLHSLHENFGFVAPEALCVGTVPVLTRNLALAAEMEAGGVAVVCDPDEASLAAAWGRAITRQRGGSVLEHGRAWVQEHLSTEAVGEQLERVYRGVANARG